MFDSLQDSSVQRVQSLEGDLLEDPYVWSYCTKRSQAAQWNGSVAMQGKAM